VEAGIVDADEVRAAERLPARDGEPVSDDVSSQDAAVALTGGHL
jgi:hypothetical protein